MILHTFTHYTRQFTGVPPQKRRKSSFLKQIFFAPASASADVVLCLPQQNLCLP